MILIKQGYEEEATSPSSPICFRNRVDIIDPILPPRIRLHIARDIRIEDHIDRLTLRVRHPLVREEVPDARVRVHVVDERRPHARHQRAQRRVRRRRARERLAVVVPDAVEVVEHEGDFLEVRRADDGGHVRPAGVEPVAVCRDGRLRPRLALPPAVGVHVVVPRVGRGAAPLVAHRGDALVAQEGGDALGWVVRVELEDALCD